jgi:two-component system alkaline phosphatase synthesis response regulator PhoP
MSATILLAIDDAGRSDAFARSMHSLGLSVERAADGEETLRLHDRLSPELIVLSTDLPDIHPLDICRHIRRESDVPLIVLGDDLGDFDTVLALEIGADDVIARDCREAEVRERVRAALRLGADVRIDMQNKEVLDFGEIVIDRRAHELIVDGRRNDLTPTEMELMWALAERADQVVGSDDLLANVWGYPKGVRTRTLDVHIGRLRRKLGEDGRNPRYIITVRSVGYRFEPHPDE